MRKIVLWAALMPFVAGGASAFAANSDQSQRIDNDHAYRAGEEMTSSQAAAATVGRGGALQDAHDQVSHSAKIIDKMMREDPSTRQALKNARGVFVIPAYGRAGLVVGGSGGPGVLMMRQGNRWIGPALYNTGSVSLGAQAGAEGGAIVMILNSDKAVRQFEQENNFSLRADAGISFIVWSARAQAETSKPDVYVWSDMKGAYAGANIAVSDANFDEGETAALYGRKVTPRDIFQGSVHTAQARSLQQALPSA